MNLTERTTAALAWIDGQLAICEGATEGPWETDLASKHPAIFNHRGDFLATDVWPNDATFIETARTGYPAMLTIAKLSIDTAQTFGLHETLESILTTIENLK
jgi:hypothetical protein